MGVMSRRWVESMGVVVRRYIDFLILYTYPSSCICSFLEKHPYFLFILLMFFVLYNNYIATCIKQFYTQGRSNLGMRLGFPM